MGPFDRLVRYLKGHRGPVAVALSGGVDSSLVLLLCREVMGREQVVALTAEAEVFTREDLEFASSVAKSLGVRHEFLRFELLKSWFFRENPKDRCYHCKRAIFEGFLDWAKREGIGVIFDGTNASDAEEGRPGIKALSELGIKSPLLECGVKKEDVRRLARGLGLSHWSRPSSPCLATRFPEGESVEAYKLEMVRRAEEELRRLLSTEVLRVRYIRGEARIEVPEGLLERAFSLRKEIADKVLRVGFRRVSLDLEGYRVPKGHSLHLGALGLQ